MFFEFSPEFRENPGIGNRFLRMIDRPGAHTRDHIAPELCLVAVTARRLDDLLKLFNQGKIRVLKLAGDAVLDFLALEHERYVLDVFFQKILPLLRIIEADRVAYLAVDEVKIFAPHHADEFRGVAVALLLVLAEKLVFARAFGQLFHLPQNRKRREAWKLRILRGTVQDAFHLARRGAEAAFIAGRLRELVADLLECRAQCLALLGCEAYRHLAGIVQFCLVERCERRDDGAHIGRVVDAIGFAEPREHRPERERPFGVRGDVAVGRDVLQVVLVDFALLRGAKKIRHLGEIDACLETREIRKLLERVELHFVCRAEHHRIDIRDACPDVHRPRLARDQQVFEGVNRTLEKIAVFYDAAVAVDQVAGERKKIEALQRGRQIAEALVVRELVVLRVDVHLRFDRHQSLAVAAGKIKAFHLYVHQHLLQVAGVGAEQGLENLLAAVAEIALCQIGRHLVPEFVGLGGTEELFQKQLALFERDHKQRMIAHVAGDAREDFFVRKLGVTSDVRVFVGVGDADAALGVALHREHPVEGVDRAVGFARIFFHAAHDGVNERGLGAAVGSVQEDELVVLPEPAEGSERPGQMILHLLLSDHLARNILDRKVKEVETLYGRLELVGLVFGRAEVIHHVGRVFCRAAQLPGRVLGHE